MCYSFRSAVLLLSVCAIACTVSPACADSNVALGKPVTLNGGFASDPALSSTLTDGVFLPKNAFYQDGTVWWDANQSPNNTIDVDLQGTFTITGLIVQADDNDAYSLDYKDTGGNWQRGWDVPNYDFEPFGMQTRPNPLDDTERFLLSSPFTATALRFYGDNFNGDRLFAVSEIQAFGVSAVPEPGILALLLGIAAPSMALLRRRHRK